MPVPAAVTGLAPQSTRSQPAVIAIPGTKRLTSRRSAQNRAAHASAYVVSDSKSKILNTLKVSVKRNSRLLALTLKGHATQIVDLEFLPSAPTQPIFVLGSCDTDGVVYLWFLHIAKDALGIDVALRMLKKYSFYSLRRSTTAYYTRIRLAGTPEDGTMVLVPNDGSNCRVVTFTCKALQPEDASKAPAIAAPDPLPQLPSPQQESLQQHNPTASLDVPPEDTSRSTAPAIATGAAVTGTVAAGVAVAGVAVAGAAVAGAASTNMAGSTALDDPVQDDYGETIIGEGLPGDHGSAKIGEPVGTFEPGMIVEEEADMDEYGNSVEHVIPAVDQGDDVYGEGVIETPTPAYAVPVEEQDGGIELSGVYEQEMETEEVIAEEVIDDDEGEIEEDEEQEYEDFEEVERVYGEGLSNGHEPNYAPPY